jgi:hypothetical protein
MFLGTKGPRTIFQISTSKGVDISQFSSMEEAEVLLPPATVMRIIGTVYVGNDLTVVTCEDDPDAPSLFG